MIVIILLVNFWARAFTSVGYCEDQPPIKAEKVDLKKIQSDYWGSKDGTEIEVVQKRKYSKTNRLETVLFGGLVATDPFLNVKNYGAAINYHFSEAFGFGLLYWNDLSSSSEALKTFEQKNGFTVNTNQPKSFMGADISYSPLYGKLSLLNKSIIYFDIHLHLGGGSRNTESGRNIAYFAGIGEQLYLSQWLSFRLDFYLMRFKENLIEKVTSDKGKVIGSRNELSSVTVAGLSLWLF